MNNLLENAAINDHFAKPGFYGKPGKNPAQWRQLIITVQSLHFCGVEHIYIYIYVVSWRIHTKMPYLCLKKKSDYSTAVEIDNGPGPLFHYFH